MPSVLSPKARAWLAAVPRVRGSNSGVSEKSGSPQRATISVLKPSGTVMVSAVLVEIA